MKSSEPELDAELDGTAMFDLAPVSLWLEDYSGVQALFEPGAPTA